MNTKKIDLKIRYESFGGIISTENPPALVFGDKKLIKSIDSEESDLWKSKDDGVLSGPIEAHYAITNYCNANCPGCYMGSGNITENGSEEEQLAKAIDIAKSLSEMKIFHVALGGGESFLVPWFFKLAAMFREQGIIPNVTTNGYEIDDKMAESCRVFGQVNVSIDGIGDMYDHTRTKGKFHLADSALKTLKKHNIRMGINCVISRKNYDYLEDIISYAKDVGVVDIEFLRFKPTGRGKDIFHEMTLSEEQGVELFPKLKKLSRKYKIGLKLDCSFTPFICYHKPSKKHLEYFAILGCDAGNWLIGVSPDGTASPCSFIEGSDIELNKLKKTWEDGDTFKEFRFWQKDNQTACKDCKYIDICKGGCHAVSHFLTGSYSEPDPECPILRRMNR